MSRTDPSHDQQKCNRPVNSLTGRLEQRPCQIILLCIDPHQIQKKVILLITIGNDPAVCKGSHKAAAYQKCPRKHIAKCLIILKAKTAGKQTIRHNDHQYEIKCLPYNIL